MMKAPWKWFTESMGAAREAGRLQSLLTLERSRTEALKSALAEYRSKYEQGVAERFLTARVTHQAFAFASDDAIQQFAALQPDEKLAEITRLTRMVAREQARVTEMSDANAQLNAMLKQLRRGEISPKSRAITEEEFGEMFDDV